MILHNLSSTPKDHNCGFTRLAKVIDKIYF